MSFSLVVGLVGVAYVVCAAVMLVGPRRVPQNSTRAVPAVLLGAGGAVLAVGAVLARGDGALGPVLEEIAFLVLLPAAVMTFPEPPRRVLDWCALLVLVGLGLSGVLWPGVPAVVGIGVPIGLACYLWLRLERDAGPPRQALTWVVVALTIISTGLFLAAFATPSETGFAGALASLALLGPAFVVGSSRPEVVDVRGIVVRLVVGAVVVVTYLAAFVLLTGLVEVLAGATLSVGTSGVLAALLGFGVHPGQRLLRGIVDQILFGHRPDPLDAARQVVTRVGDDPVDGLRAVRDALVLPYVALRDGDGRLVEVGVPPPHLRAFPLQDGGELVVGLRAGDLDLTREERLVLQIVAPLLAQSVRAHTLAVALQESRSATVAAREEERRRLRRDLHDGLGPLLTGIAFTADAIGNLLDTTPPNPAGARELLSVLRREAGRAIVDVRGLVDQMRPPALDELGLVPALRQHAYALRDSQGRTVVVEVIAGDLPADLPAALEVAVYRIVTEALANVARHSGSPWARVSLLVDGGNLRVDVSDGGTSSDWSAGLGSGVGTGSMRERAAELGGRLEVGPTPSGGRVLAVLPLGLAGADRAWPRGNRRPGRRR